MNYAIIFALENLVLRTDETNSNKKTDYREKISAGTDIRQDQINNCHYVATLLISWNSLLDGTLKLMSYTLNFFLASQWNSRSQTSVSYSDENPWNVFFYPRR